MTAPTAKNNTPVLSSMVSGEPLSIAMPTQAFKKITGHAGQARHWLVCRVRPYQGNPPESKQENNSPLQWQHVELSMEQVLHHFDDQSPHPLDGVRLILCRSAGDGFVRHMAKRGAEVLITGEEDPQQAISKLLQGLALDSPRFDWTTSLCRVRDLFSRH